MRLADTGALEGKVSGLKRSHVVAFVRELNKGFITDGEQGKIVIFDLKTLKVIGDAKAASDGDSILYDPASKRVFSFNGDSNNSTVVDAESGKVVGTIDLGGGPEFAVADGRGMIYNNIEDKSEIVAIDSKTLSISRDGRLRLTALLRRWPLIPSIGDFLFQAANPRCLSS